MAMIIGLTAPFQHGKTELRPVIKDAGWRFIDLNDLQNRMRRKGTPRHVRYDSLIPGSLDDEGGETVEYYRHVTSDMREQLIPEEVGFVASETLRLIETIGSAEAAVLSWELWPKLLGRVPISHMLVFAQPMERWMDRLHRRIKERGWGSWTPDDAEIIRLIRTMDAVPENILAAIRTSMPGRFTVIDVSPDDWGAASLLETLAHLRTIA